MDAGNEDQEHAAESEASDESLLKQQPTSPAPVAAPVEDSGADDERSVFRIVGVGASAGGLEAFTQMLRALPVDTGMAFVLVQHLSPSRVSMLADILSRATTMPVMEVHDEPVVEPNHVYVIPPDRDMTMAKGVLQLLPRQEGRGPPRSIDCFFRSLAEERKHKAIGVILSGTATDGTLGLEEIKAAGGITFVQDETAQHNSMPRSAVAAGCVDFILPPDQIAQELARIAQHPYVAPAPAAKPPPLAGEPALGRILGLLHRETGVDFTQYKGSTLYRRITRRMVLHKQEGLEDYARLLEENPAEPKALFEDILISVTSFFRDPEMFEVLKAEVFPKLFQDRSRHDPVRVWVLGCSTGEEAYSLAMAFAEFAEEQNGRPPAQIFATDLNAAGIEKARAGVYSKNIEHDVPPNRLRRFFVEVAGNYRVNKEIRDMCVFARHNVLADPPFSRIDMISCRNLLIYLEPALQQKIMPLLHYALKPAGFLVLGSSETIGSYRDLFELEDARRKIYTSKPGTSRLTFGLARVGHAGRPHEAGALPHRLREALGGVDVQKEADRLLLAKYAPPGVLVNDELEILQFRGDTGQYLAPAPGRATLDLLKMAREGLLVSLRAAIIRAKKEEAAVREEGIRIKWNGGYRLVNLEVIPVKGNGPRERGFLVLFDETPPRDRTSSNVPAPEISRASAVPEQTDEKVVRLEQELAATREYLQSVVEQQEAANEELQSANEEVQSANEELQSTNEELETSKEEIQSSNEELATVNDELHNRNLELGQLNNDLTNLVSSVQMAIVMVGPDLRIRRFTPTAEKLLNLISADVGRPIGDVKLNLNVAGLEPLLTEVIDTVSHRECEVQDMQGRWYSLRIHPYRTLENKIDGAVLVLVDIDALRRAYQYVERIVREVRQPHLVLNEDLTVRMANRSFCEGFQVTPEETVGRRVYDLGNGQWNIPELRRLLEQILPQDNEVNDYEVTHDFQHIGRKTMRLSGRRLVEERHRSPAILLAIDDVTEEARQRDALKRQVSELTAEDRRKNEFLAMLAHELRNPLAPIRNAVQILLAAKADPAAPPRAIEMIDRQVQNMTRLVDDLLDVSRINQGKIELKTGPVALSNVLTGAVESVQDQFQTRDQDVAMSLPQEPIYLQADATRLEQVFANLLSNASKFTGPGGRIWLTAERASGNEESRGTMGSAGAVGGAQEVVIRVRDEGIGIAPEMLPRVFDLFAQADNSLERAQQGLGIGLTLVKTLVEMHGGQVEAHSAGAGQGSEFAVRLPILAQPPEPQPAAQPRAPDQPAAFRRRILVVDDNRDAAMSLAMLLKIEGHEVQTAHDGVEAVQHAATFRPDVVLLDLGLPKLNGFEVARQIREQSGGRSVVLVALTGWGQEDDRRRTREAGFDHHLVKPVDLAVLNRFLS